MRSLPALPRAFGGNATVTPKNSLVNPYKGIDTFVRVDISR